MKLNTPNVLAVTHDTKVLDKINWCVTPFQLLSPLELYDILWLRSETFVVEQKILFNDMDYLDQTAYHVLGKLDGKIVAHSRLFNRGDKYAEISIGRVAVHSGCRGIGLGKVLMRYSIDQCAALFGNGTIKIGAQAHLERFYNDLGFEKTGKPYMEDTIPHIYMLRHQR